MFESFQKIYATLHDKKDVQEVVKKYIDTHLDAPTVCTRYVLRVLRVWRNWYIFSNDYLNGLQSTFLAPSITDGEIALRLKKLEGVSEEEIERKCRFNGLSLDGGMKQQKLRCVRLDVYLEGTAPDRPRGRKTKKTRKLPSKAQKRDIPQPKQPVEAKPSRWVSIEQEHEKQPAVPISQWLQEEV